MPLQKIDKEFRLPKISYLDFKQTEMDRVLTVLFARLRHRGFSSRLGRLYPTTIEMFMEEFLRHPEWFSGFGEHRDILRRWLETHLLDLVNRGKPDQEAVASPRPLHGLTYRFRNPKHCRDYGASRQIYEMLRFARANRGQAAIDRLKDFFFAGLDTVTKHVLEGATIDVETQALLRLTDQVERDAPDTRDDEGTYPPACIGAADLLVDDIIRLLIYRDYIPRSVMVDYLKIIISLHLALYHLRLMKMLPLLVKRQEANPICRPTRCPVDVHNSGCPFGSCPYRIGLVVDVANIPKTRMAALSAASADVHYRRIPTFLKAYFSVRKLDELAKHLRMINRLQSEELAMGEILELQKPKWADDRKIFFGKRLVSLFETDRADAPRDPEIQAICELGLDEFNLYIECIFLFASNTPRRNLVQGIDSLLLKNRPGALIAQSRARHAPRRFILDSRLLEVLLQIAVLRTGGTLGYYTAEIRIEDLLQFIRERYGIYIDRLPDGEGFGHPNIDDRAALRKNVEAFKNKLREIGFYQDLSDAYITQHVTPRYVIRPGADADPAALEPPE